MGDPAAAQNPRAFGRVKDAGLTGADAFFGGKQLDLGAWAAEKYRIGGSSDEGPSSEEDGGDTRRDV